MSHYVWEAKRAGKSRQRNSEAYELKLVRYHDGAMLQVSGALRSHARNSGLPDPDLVARLGARFFKIQARQPEPLAIAVPLVSSTGN
jgi:hypothetical protein